MTPPKISSAQQSKVWQALYRADMAICQCDATVASPEVAASLQGLSEAVHGLLAAFDIAPDDGGEG